jgi:hypothetical protein
VKYKIVNIKSYSAISVNVTLVTSSELSTGGYLSLPTRVWRVANVFTLPVAIIARRYTVFSGNELASVSTTITSPSVPSYVAVAVPTVRVS